MSLINKTSLIIFCILAGLVLLGIGLARNPYILGGVADLLGRGPAPFFRFQSPTDNNGFTISPSSPEPINLASSWNGFGFKLLNKLAEQHQQENTVISPTSIAMALSLAASGARGETLAGIEGGLQLPIVGSAVINAEVSKFMTELVATNPEVTLQIANSVWLRSEFSVKEPFLQNAQSLYGARVETIDFASPTAPDIINRWVSDQTKGKINQIVAGPIDPSVMMYLVNAVYFKGSWTHAFDADITHERPFTLPNGSNKNVMMMKQTRTDFSYNESEQYQAIQLPYGQSGRFVMNIVLPEKDVRQFANQLNDQSWQSLMAQLHPQEGSLLLPKFTLEYDQALGETLQSLGMKTAFSDQADFTGITDMPLKITQVKHKTFMEVNEEGTEAAAVTGVEMSTTSMPINPPKRFIMEVNRPFLLAITDTQAQHILFLGIVNEPR